MNQQVDLSPQQVVAVSQTAVRFLGLETTLIPGNMRQQVAVLEVFLNGLATGQLQLASTVPPAVESDADTGADASAKQAKKAEADGAGSSTDDQGSESGGES